MKSLNSINVLTIVALMGFSACTNKSITTKGEYDDMYASSADAPVLYAQAYSKQASPSVESTPYDDSYDRVYGGQPAESSEEYFDEEYLTSRSLKRANTPTPGYSDGYADGYSQGWNDNSWTQPMGWNSPFNRFAYSPFGWNSFNSWGGYNSWGGMGYNSWGYSPWSSGIYMSWGMMDPFFGNSWGYSPWGYNSWGYSPWGYNSMAYYGGWGSRYGYGSPYYGYQPVYYGNSWGDNRYTTGKRTYGTREGGRNTAAYNDRFTNTVRPSVASNGGRRNSDGVSRDSYTGTNSRPADRKNGSWTGGTSESSRGTANTRSSYDPSSRRPASYDSYARGSSSNPGSSSLSRSFDNNRSSSSNTGSYSNPSSMSRSASESSYSRGSSSPSRSSSTGYSRPSSSYDNSNSRGSSSSNSNSWNSSRSSSPSPSSSGSSGGSRGSSGGGSSSGGSSRGPR